ncbi:hypothetical protein [Mesorhizobium sp. IMUNJ 23232]|uniref:hypothetical protein n=1 Tax=Mesorhizobium sp. IMUNJ 23232 TaxID=3376064 RepID=UPI0037A09F90
MAHNWTAGVAGAVATAGIVLIGPSSAQTQAPTQSNGVCLQRAQLEADLAKDFQERQSAYGRVGDAAIMEIYASEGGTWTLVMTDVGGTSCIIAAGDGWEQGFTTVGSRA